jgi:hypothetical protein
MPCGFCSTADCHLCPETIKIGSGESARLWHCPCAQKDHQLTTRKGTR